MKQGHRMKLCRICNREIERWQSYHSDGNTLEHMMCMIRKAPAPFPSVHLDRAYLLSGRKENRVESEELP